LIAICYTLHAMFPISCSIWCKSFTIIHTFNISYIYNILFPKYINLYVFMHYWPKYLTGYYRAFDWCLLRLTSLHRQYYITHILHSTYYILNITYCTYIIYTVLIHIVPYLTYPPVHVCVYMGTLWRTLYYETSLYMSDARLSLPHIIIYTVSLYTRLLIARHSALSTFCTHIYNIHHITCCAYASLMIYDSITCHLCLIYTHTPYQYSCYTTMCETWRWQAISLHLAIFCRLYCMYFIPSYVRTIPHHLHMSYK
jgi:hypothetical protein